MAKNCEHGETILVVDDDQELAQFEAMVLEGEGYNVETCYGPLEALEATKRRRPDAIVADLMMPVMSGIELLRMLGETEATRGIPAMMVTAADSMEGEILGCAEVTTMLTKPFDVSKFLRGVAMLLV